MQNAARVATPQALVDSVLHLISLPEIYLRLQRTIDDPEHTREQVAEILAHDPALSARVLRIANSSYYGFSRSIATVNEAVGIIGELDLRNLALAASLVGSLAALDRSGVDLDRFWQHSLRTAILARLIARAAGGCNPETLFLAGMLHDLGILVIYQQDPDLALAVGRQVSELHQLRDQAERELLGFDHAEVGGLLIEAWGLTPELVELVRCHHQYQLARKHPRATQILALANLLAIDDDEAESPDDIRLRTLGTALGVDSGRLDSIVAEGATQCEEIRNFLLG